MAPGVSLNLSVLFCVKGFKRQLQRMAEDLNYWIIRL
jgi:hypothetical protein